MNVKEIENILQQYNLFRGVFALNKIPKTVQAPGALVANTKPLGEDGHWLGIFITCSNYGFYFDSFGLPPRQTELRDFMQENCEKWFFSSKTVQSMHTTTCGLFVCGFIIAMCEGSSLQSYLDSFSDDLAENDLKITDSINHLYKTNFKPFDASFF